MAMPAPVHRAATWVRRHASWNTLIVPAAALIGGFLGGGLAYLIATWLGL